ncbi:MAG: hypothetical protein KDA53_02970 [Hyphomonas sp.]|nr:hypothetical protein [Hyphomonas sp.]
MRLAVMAGLAMLAAGAATADTGEAADCGTARSQSIYNTVLSVRAQATTLEDGLKTFEAAAEQCPDNAWAQHYAAFGHYSHSGTLNEAKAGDEAVLSELSAAFQRSQAYWTLEDRHQEIHVKTAVGLSELAVPFSEVTTLRKEVITTLLNIHAFSGVSHGYITSTDTPEACTDNLFWDISAARGWYTDHRDGGHIAIPFAERLVAACPLLNKSGGVDLAQEAVMNMRLTYAEAIVETDVERTRELVAAIKAYRDGVLKPGETHNYAWHDYDGSKLSRIEARLPAIVTIPTGKEDPLVSAGAVPAEEWFLETPASPKVRESIGQTMNAYVADKGSVAFASAVGKMFVLTKSAPDPAAARQTLYWTALSYDGGSWRTSDTVETEVYDVVYKWLKDYKEAE